MTNDRVTAEGLVKLFRRIPRRTLKAAVLEAWRHSDRPRAGEFLAIDGLSFRVAPGECLGVIGANGSGKSTLLKLISGILVPDGGTVAVRGRIAPLIELEAGFHPDLTGRENVFLNAAILGLPLRETERRFGRIVDFAGLGEFIETPVKHYSSGMKARLGFSVAVHVDAEVLLVDEVLEVGDAAFRPLCYRRISELKEAGAVVIYVSHNLASVEGICDRALWLEGGRLRLAGPAGEVTAAYRGAVGAGDPTGGR